MSQKFKVICFGNHGKKSISSASSFYFSCLHLKEFTFERKEESMHKFLKALAFTEAL